MEKLKFSKDNINYVCCLIRNHMHGYNLPDEISKKSYIKLFNKLEKNNVPIEDFVALTYCDNQGNEAKERISFLEFLKNNHHIKKYYELKYSKEPFNTRDLAINGKDLIERYGVEEGYGLGRMLKDILEKIIDGDLKNERADIFNYLNTNIDGGV